jgi:hypothetical protein
MCTRGEIWNLIDVVACGDHPPCTDGQQPRMQSLGVQVQREARTCTSIYSFGKEERQGQVQRLSWFRATRFQ